MEKSKKAQTVRMQNLLTDLDDKNTICADCKQSGPEYMAFASINNGIIICSTCAEKHKKLGNGISYLHSLSERWDDYLLNYIRNGGNSRFFNFERAYKIGKLDILSKYRSRAMNYYREILRSEVMGYDPPDNININTACEILENIENNYPEFDNYSYVKHVDLEKLQKNIENKRKNESKFGGFFGKFTNKIGGFSGITGKLNDYWGSFSKKIDEGMDIISNKVSELKVGETVYGKLKGFLGEEDEDNEENNENNKEIIVENKEINKEKPIENKDNINKTLENILNENTEKNINIAGDYQNNNIDIKESNENIDNKENIINKENVDNKAIEDKINAMTLDDILNEDTKFNIGDLNVNKGDDINIANNNGNANSSNNIESSSNDNKDASNNTNKEVEDEDNFLKKIKEIENL